MGYKGEASTKSDHENYHKSIQTPPNLWLETLYDGDLCDTDDFYDEFVGRA